MDASAFSCKFDPGHLGLLDLLCTEFLSEGGGARQKIVCELYKLNVYGTSIALSSFAFVSV